jgi:hypothetical protein
MGTDEREKTAVERAKEYGIDVSLLYESIEQTPTERIECFLKWLEFAEAVKEAGEKKRRNA